MNRLYYEKATGVLYDQWLREHNVALRRDTVRQLVGAIVENGAPPRQPRQRSDIQFEVGCRIGREFHDVFRERSKKGGARDSGKPFLERMLAYDSSSGMGQFDLVEYNAETPRIKIVVKNAFTQLHVGDPVSEFLKGYLVGMCSEVVGHQLRVDGQALREPSAVELVFHK